MGHFAICCYAGDKWPVWQLALGFSCSVSVLPTGSSHCCGYQGGK